MDLIQQIRDREKQELEEKLVEFDTTILVMSHTGDVAPAGGFEVVRARTLKEFMNAEPQKIYAFDDEDEELAKLIVTFPDAIGFNVRYVESYPDQHSAASISAIFASLPRVDFLRLLGDIADQKLMLDSMTESEREQSIAKRQHAQRANKEGEIKPLIDFDRSFAEDDLANPPTED